jgi:hypothetical protein
MEQSEVGVGERPQDYSREPQQELFRSDVSSYHQKAIRKFSGFSLSLSVISERKEKQVYNLWNPEEDK